MESFNNVVGLLTSSIIKKTLQRRRLPVELRTFLRTSILKNICKRLRFSFCIKIYRFVYQFDTAIIRGSRPVAFCEKGVLTSFTKSTRKNQRYSLVFNAVADLQSLTLSKKRFWHLTLFCKFCEIYHNIFLKELFGRLFLPKHWLFLMSHRDLSPFMSHIFSS